MATQLYRIDEEPKEEPTSPMYPYHALARGRELFRAIKEQDPTMVRRSEWQDLRDLSAGGFWRSEGGDERQHTKPEYPWGKPLYFISRSPY